MQKEALVFLANVLYFLEWKKVIQLLLAQLKSLLSITYASKLLVDDDAESNSIISLILNGPWLEKKGLNILPF